MNTVLIDHYDSFTYNLAQLITETTQKYPVIVQHDACSYEDLQHIPHDNIVLSPGPGHPGCDRDFLLGRAILEKSRVPVLGVCLGHQGIGHVFGAHVMLAKEPMHGRVSRITHEQDPLFANIPVSFNAVRYHSWVLNDPLPPSLRVIARTETDGAIMAIRHQTKPLWGVQYHPESICTEYGYQLLLNFMRLSWEHHHVSSNT